ncbi:unnamed protein product [Rotaria sordida]|nr:unnamed protein product [Rotaria sordida]
MGDIIIATNKGGRGTDIHVNPNMNAKGGMHVILGYLPENVRIEEQAFGRTARNGAAGTGQFILQVDKSTYEKIYDLSQYPRDIQQMKLADLSDAIIEREKINRDNKEAARLSELKKKSILRLEVEEELFDKFNEFKRNITDKVFKTLFESKPNENKEKFVAVFQNVLKDRWAFWLDKAKDDIDAIKTSGQKSSLLNKYDSSFIGELTRTLENSSFNHLLKNFIERPEEAMQVGQVCLSVEEFSMAKMCFEKAVTCGDSSGFSYMGIAFCIIKLRDGGNVKKESRRELKKAIRCLESIKRNLMANLKIAEILPQSASAEIFQKISSKENLYEDQIRGKIEIIGLHLHYLNNAVGQTVEPYDFILHQQEGEELTKEKKEKGERLYKSLVDGGLIQGNRRRKAFENATQRAKMKQEIRDNVDPSIAESIILLLDENKCQQKDFENIVCYNDQLWEVLNIRHTEDVFILDKSRIERVLPQEYEKLWKDLEDRIDPSHVDISLFETNSGMKQFRVYLEEKNMLSKTKRAKIEQLNPESLRFDGVYEKYSRINFNDHGHKPSNLKTFLEKLKEQIISQGDEYIYQTDLPYSTQEEEAKKILMFLKDKNIIKSGGLAIHKHGNRSEDIDNLLDKILPNVFINDKDLIKSKILALQGDIRSCEEDLKATLKDFIDLKDQEKVPNELKFFEGLGLNKFLIIEEDKSWWDWNAFAVAMIGLAQVIGGAVLIAFGCVNIGGALIAEGINDMIYATMAGLSGTFSWKDWAIQKAISFSISLLTCGIGKLASIGTTVATVGSVSITAIVTQVVKQAVYQFATTCLSKIADEKINETMKALLVPKLVKLVEDNLLQGVSAKTNEKVKRLYTTSKDEIEFEQGFVELKQNIEVALGKNVFNQQFDNIRIQVASAFKKSYDTILKGLSNSSSKYLKMAASAIKIGLLVDKIVNGVQYALKLANTFQAFIKIFDNQIAGKYEGEEKREEDTTIIKHRSDQLISIIKAYVTKVLTQGLVTILTKIMNGEFIRMAKNMVNFVKTSINEEFNQKNPIDTLKNSKQNVTEDGQNQVLVEQPCDIDNSSQERQDEMERDDIQNNIQNPKKLMENMSNETNDGNRALGRPDIQMLADKKCRDIIIYNKDTGETETIRPSGLRKIPAFFKQEAKIYYEGGENGDIGHLTNARGSEVYKQLNGRNDCLFIAYNESLGKTVDENFIQRERENFDRYIAENQTRYSQYRENENVNGRSEIIGGGQRTKRNYFEGVENLHERSAKRDPSSKQHSGESDHAQDRSSSSGVGTTKIDVTNFSVDETKETVGTYKDLDKQWKGRKFKYELNHIPPKDSYKDTPYQDIKMEDMPVIAMKYKDHRCYISTGRSQESIVYREQIRQHLKQGDFCSALNLEFVYMSKSGSPEGIYKSDINKFIDFLETKPIKNHPTRGKSAPLITTEQAKKLKDDLLS